MPRVSPLTEADKARIAENARKRYAANPAKFRKYKSKWRKKNLAVVRAQERAYYAKKQQTGDTKERRYKQLCIEHYGKVCACCGESEPMFLTIDHKNNDGYECRKNRSGANLTRWLVQNNFPEDFQLLCMNCNWGKYLNGGICPHQGKKEGFVLHKNFTRQTPVIAT